MQIEQVEQVVPHRRAMGIPENGWAMTDGGVLITKDVESHAAVAVLNMQTHQGYLGNFSTIEIYSNNSYKKFVDRLRETEFSAEISVWLGGISLLDNADYNQEIINTYHEKTNAASLQIEQDMQDLSDNMHVTKNWLGVNEIMPAIQLDCARAVLQFCVKPQFPNS